MSGKSDAKRITWYANLCSKLLDEVAELKQRIKELEAQLDRNMRTAELHTEASKTAHIRYFELSSKYTEAVKRIAELERTVNMTYSVQKKQAERIAELEDEAKLYHRLWYEQIIFNEKQKERIAELDEHNNALIEFLKELIGGDE